jgi:PAS domain S-box-containing protein
MAPSAYALPSHIAPYLETVWNISSDAMALSDAEGTVLAINPAYTQLYGFTPEEAVGENFSIIFPAAEREDACAQYKLAFQRAPAEALYESVVRRADGQVRLVESRVAFVEQDGQRVAMISVVRDVTQYKQAEIDLAESRSFVEHVLETTPDFVVVHDRLAGRDVRLNNRLETILGVNRYAGEPGSGEDFYGQFHPDDLALFLGAQQRIAQAADGELVQTELRMRHVDGSWRWLLMRQMVFRRDSSGAPHQVLTLLHDITPRKQLEESLRKLNAELELRVEQRTQELRTANLALEQAAQLKDEFLASVSHELRTPLTAILSFAEVFQQEVYGPLTPRQFRAIGFVQASALRLLDLINNILEFSKSEAGTLAVAPKLLRLDDACRTALSLVQEAAAAKQQQVQYAIDSPEITTTVDPRCLTQILVNLLNNAIKFTPAGGDLGLEVRGDAERRQLQLRIWDCGIGIDAEHQQLLFQPFTQLDRGLARQHEGIGLGLALSHHLVHLLGGSIVVHSEPGAGSEFVVTLPWVAA